MYISVDSALKEKLPATKSFPFNLSESASHAFGSIGQFVSGGNLATTGLALDMHDGVQSQRVSASAGSTDDGQAISEEGESARV